MLNEQTFMTMPNARFIRIRSYVGGWGAGQWWLDDFRLERVDGQLKNVVSTCEETEKERERERGGWSHAIEVLTYNRTRCVKTCINICVYSLVEAVFVFCHPVLKWIELTYRGS